MQLSKYLLRTHCSEIMNELALYLAGDSQIELKNDKELSSEVCLLHFKNLSLENAASFTFFPKNLVSS